MNNSIIELHVDDFAPAKSFYHGLGFKTVWETETTGKEGYLVLELEENLICFWCGNEHVYEHHYFKDFPEGTARGYGVEIVIQLADVEAFYQQVQDKCEILRCLQSKPWGLKDFRTKDPYGFYLRFTEKEDIRERMSYKNKS